MKNQSHKSISRYDLKQLLHAIKHAVAAEPYPTAAHFRATTESVVGACIRG